MTFTQRRESDLVQALLELESHVNDAGWDQPHRLFALADAHDLHSREPGLLPTAPGRPGELVAVEQALTMTATEPAELLARLAWPELIVGAAITLERVMVPTATEQAAIEDAACGLIDTDQRDCVITASRHPDRAEVRLAVAVTRDGQRMCALRFRDHDSDDEVLTGANLVDSVAEALLATFD